MSGSPDFTFSLKEGTTKFTKGNDDLLGLYMAAMLKCALENRQAAANEKAVKLNAIKILLSYCENANNNMQLTKGLKKLSEAYKKDELEGTL